MARRLEALTLPLTGRRLIEASAGTGKTYTIAALYLRLVLGHGTAQNRSVQIRSAQNRSGQNRSDQNRSGQERPGQDQLDPLMPPRILVVTFTNAATEELRDRIRDRLTGAAAVFRQLETGDDFLNALRDQYPRRDWPSRALVLEQAAQWMDEAAIYTIHGWCQRMLSQHAFASGSLFDLKLEPGDDVLLEEAACDYWRQYLYPLPADHLVLLKDIGGWETPHTLLARIQYLGDHRFGPCDDPFVLLAQQQTEIEKTRILWAAGIGRALPKLDAALATKTLSGRYYRAVWLIEWQQQMLAWAKGTGPLPDRKVLAKFSTGGLNKGRAKGCTPPDDPLFKATETLLEVLVTDLEPLLLAHAAGHIRERYHDAKQRQGLLTFDDLLTRLNDALKREDRQDLALIIREQYPVALIDEFQDTDPVQYDIFSRVYGNAPATGLLMIGDPKQAIYGFRGADIYTYLQARAESSAGRYTLDKNYRSGTSLVAAVNQLFASGRRHPRGAFLFEDKIPYDPVAARGRDRQFVVSGGNAEGLTCWVLPQDGPVTKTGEGGYLSRMAWATANEVARLLNLAAEIPPRAGFRADPDQLSPLLPADIAILVRDHREARAMRSALARCRVRSVYLSDKDSVFDSDEALSLVYILRACMQPERAATLKAALSTPVLGRSVAWLDRLSREEQVWEAEVERFQDYRRVWDQQGVLPMLRMLLHDYKIPALLLAQGGGERRLTNLLHLSELLQTAALELSGRQALLRWLVNQRAQIGTRDDEQVLRLESEEALVRVVTIHKSKGLEYPLVFLPFICTFRAVSRRYQKTIRYHDAQQKPVWALKPTDDEYRLADGERLAEDLRLLYVAVTRAQFACWLGVGVMGRTTAKGEQSQLHQCGLGYLLSGGKAIATAEVQPHLNAVKGDCRHFIVQSLPEPEDEMRYTPPATMERPGPARRFSSKVYDDWSITSYSGIVSGAESGVAPAGTPPVPERALDYPDSALEDQLAEAEQETAGGEPAAGVVQSLHEFPRGPDPGTFLHGLLEAAAEHGFKAIAADSKACRDLIETHAFQHGLGEWTEPLNDWLGELLHTSFKLPGEGRSLSLAELKPRDYVVEMEFMVAIDHLEVTALDREIRSTVMPGGGRPALVPNVLNGMLKGFIDLVCCQRDQYYLIDYKSNWLGPDHRAYGAEAMASAMCEHRYDVQYVLYTLAMHRLLKARLAGYDYDRHLGGAIYLFLRGVDPTSPSSPDRNGFYLDKPPRSLIEWLDVRFTGREAVHDI